jgi:hypothetical protein
VQKERKPSKGEKKWKDTYVIKRVKCKKKENKGDKENYYIKFSIKVLD